MERVIRAFILHLLQLQLRVLAHCRLEGGGSIDKTIPSTALLARRIRCEDLVQVIVRVVGMPGDEAVFGPPGEGRFVDIEARSRFPFCQHSAIAKSIIARAEAVAVDEIGDPQGREAGIVAAAPRGSSRAKSSLVEEFGDLGIDVFVEELVDQFDDTGLRLHLLRG